MTKAMESGVSRRGMLGGGIALAAGAAVASTRGAQAQEAAKTFVLVHGSWHGGWCWQKVADALRTRGHRVYTPTLTGLGERSHLMSGLVDLNTHITDVVKVIRYESLEQIVLVGHSYAGWVVSGVAEQAQDKVASIVFLDAFLPKNGERLLDYSDQADVDAQTDMWNHGVVDRPAIPSSIFGISDADTATVDAKLTPQPLGPSFTRLGLTGARDRIGRKTYIRDVLYNSATFDAAYAACRTDASWKTFELQSGYDAMLIVPDQLTEILASA